MTNNQQESEINSTHDENEEMKWYVLVVNPKLEISIRDKLLGLSKTKQFENLIKDVKVIATPGETSTGKKKETIEDYTQYVFVQMVHTNETYNAVKIKGVRHILGAPTPLTREDIERMFGELS